MKNALIILALFLSVTSHAFEYVNDGGVKLWLPEIKFYDVYSLYLSSYNESAVNEEYKISINLDAPEAPLIEESPSFITPEMKELASDLASPVKSYYSSEDVTEADKSAMYIDVTGILLSHYIRNKTGGYFDFRLLSNSSLKNTHYVSGAEVGINPVDSFGMRFSLEKEDEFVNRYGLSLDFNTRNNHTITLKGADNKTESTMGVDFKLRF